MRPSAGTKRASAGSLPLSATLKGENLERCMNGARQGRKRREGGSDGAALDVIRDGAGLQGRAGGRCLLHPQGGQMRRRGGNVKARKAQLVRHVLHPRGQKDETMQDVA